MIYCRVCGSECGPPVYHAGAPAVTSLSSLLDATTTCHVCRTCGHAQSPDLPDLKAFYDTEYRISLASDDHDQLYEMRDGVPLYRTAKQAELVLLHAEPKSGARVLDYGAAKAATLRALMDQRPDLLPHVFDVSEDYVAYWESWVPPKAQSTYRVPDAWNGTFDLVTAHFVLEHVADPVAIFKDIARLLAPEGKAFVTVPNVIANPGDLLVVDHLNHFTRPSLQRALAAAGLVASEILEDAFRGGFVVVAGKGDPASLEPTEPAVAALDEIADFWSGAHDRLTAAADRHGSQQAMIYGAGFYGVYIASVLRDRQRLAGHLDRNPHARESASVSPVYDPASDLPEFGVLYAGLNPKIARSILSDWLTETGKSDLPIVYLD